MIRPSTLLHSKAPRIPAVAGESRHNPASRVRRIAVGRRDSHFPVESSRSDDLAGIGAVGDCVL